MKHVHEQVREYQYGGPDPEQWVEITCSVTEGDTGCGCSDPHGQDTCKACGHPIERVSDGR